MYSHSLYLAWVLVRCRDLFDMRLQVCHQLAYIVRLVFGRQDDERLHHLGEECILSLWSAQTFKVLLQEGKLHYCDNCMAVVRTSPLIGSGLLTTADSATASCSIRAFSTSNGPIRYLNPRSELVNLFFQYFASTSKKGPL